MDHRQHFYHRYTSAQSRFASIGDARARVAVEHLSLEACVAPFLPSDRTVRVLDLGCGYGAFLLFLQAKGFTNLRGVDLSPEQVQLAKDLGLECVEIDSLFAAIPIEHNIGMVTMFDVIEHLTRIEAIQALQAIYEALKPGGVLILRTPNVDARLGSVLSYGDLTHEMHLNKISVLELFASLPFTSVQILPVQVSGGGLAARLIRTIISPLLSFVNRCNHLVQGIPWSSTIKTPNMLIVARR